MDKVNVLWLPGWFPSRVNFLSGDFIERHAAALSIYRKVVVIFAVKDPLLDKPFEIVKETKGALLIYRGYYAGINSPGLLHKASSVTSYYKLLFRLYKLAVKENGEFAIVHLHVVLRQSLLALWLRSRKNIPYYITEHSTDYDPVYGNHSDRNVSTKKFREYVFRKAVKVTAVSANLGEWLQHARLVRNFLVIPNVVDTNIFRLTPHSSSICSFATITGDIYHKNTDGVIRSFAEARTENSKVQLHIIGPGYESLVPLVSSLGIVDAVIFHGAVKYEQVAEILQQCDALIFFSRYETFGCVVAEAMCCGLPVIASKLPVLEENFPEDKGVIYVESANESDLKEKLLAFITDHEKYDRNVIAGYAKERYNYKTVGLQLNHVYNI